MAVMRFVLMTVAMLLGLATPAAAELAGSGGPHITASLVPESSAPAAGQRTTLAIYMVPQPGWHGYWRTPGDTGYPMKIDWTLPKGTTAGDPAYPVPTTLVIAGLMNHVFEKPYALLVPFDVPAGLAKGTKLPVSAKLDYLVCSPSICVPESASISTTLTAGDGTPDATSAAKFDAWRKALPRPLGSPAEFEVKNGKFRIAVPLPASVTPNQPHLFAVTDGAVNYAAPQTVSRDGDTLVIETAAGTTPPKSFEGVLSLGDGTGLSLTATPGAVPAAGASGTASHGTLMLALIAFAGALLGGLILNIMPCVFPILSLKALSLAKAGGDERTVRREALAYTAGVILVCVGLGGVILGLKAAGTQVGWAFQLQDPRVILVLILLTSAIGFNLAGLFEFGAVSAGSDLAAKGGTAGAFWTGALAAFVAMPCTGPFMASALGVAVELPAAAALLVFVGLGIGFALPFLLIGYVPAFRRLLPKPGGWMETFKRILAVPMFLTALGLAWVLGHQTQANGVVVGLGAAMLLAFGLWLTGLRQRGFKAASWVPAAAGLLLAVGSMALLPPKETKATEASTTSQPFDEAKLAALRAQGKPVFLYFTADWCLSCKVNEKVAIERTETQEAFRKAGVVTMVGDWTDGDAAIGRFLEAHGRSGVPLYLWYAPGSSQPKELPQVLTPGLLAGLAKS
ncbi:thioredoxin family protein [Sphingomonas sp. CGMCC 1.13654]|uniref:Thioredoxin family protein n=1 Tax=Sphingomonas chungangi TaxID=2683589 RepID=A0A838L2B2_9SPHN|nr:protein-disulfide reductase DsbD domain-containing protein [Sphingomonas chungangi]MBA2933197.1 thioredoxin family protein [Sphingomonas chungangi]MVW57869.1 thiol:disulfide interchange protein [Sphingomonas chungangi]